jgi:methylmalonyl-CoA/ethylmalonyl-CoA epimerase
MNLQLHHIGIVVADIDRHRALYVDRLGFAVHSDIIHDPVQTAYVQFLRLPGDSTYIELVAPDGEGSKLQNALGKGGGLNHLCYSTGDIEAACHDLRKRGSVIIQAPVAATAFNGRRIAWIMGTDRVLTELVERGAPGEL